MSRKLQSIDSALDDVVTLGSIGAIAALAVHGIADPFVISVIAGLGGYRVHQKQKARASAAATEE
jgi:hypothetical protein